MLLAGCNKNLGMSQAIVSGGLITANADEKDRTTDDLKDNEIAFTKTKYFYSEDINLKILSKKACTIYYTTDGTNPDNKKTLYKNEIKLTALETLKVVSIKAKAYFEDGTESDTIVHSYFMGTKVNNRFDTLVFSVTTDPYNLTDYKYGIFVTGKLRDDYIKEHPGEKINPNAPANYNMRGKDSERPVYLEILEPNGTNIADQAAGIRTYGGWSRDNNQKPIKIFTRKEYDKKNSKIKYDFFPDKTAANGDGTILDSFNRLVLRNCGNDNGIAFIRDELFETLASQAGYADYEAVRPAALFINGEYRGFYWLHENYCDEYFQQNYGDYTGKFEILEGEETKKTLDEESKNENIVAEYENMYSTYSNMDLTIDKNYQALCKKVDVENYLSYFALQIYIGNGDWPDNNYKTYRYYPKKGEKYREAPFDGKWRYMLHDLDFSFAIYGKGALVDEIGDYLENNTDEKYKCPLFRQLMKRADCKEIFIKKTADLINGAYSPNNINKVMTKMNNSRLNELQNTYGKGIFSNWSQYSQLDGKLNEILRYGTERAEHIITKYQEYFHLDDIYQLRAQPVEGCKLKINSYMTDKYFEGKYYSDYNTKISAVIPAGEELDYWLCNGEKVYGDDLIITPQSIKGGEVVVTFVLKETNKNPHLIISELSEDKNMIVLYNPYKEAVSMEGYTLSDDGKNIKKLVMPAKSIAPGEKYQVILKKADIKKKEKETKYIQIKAGNTIKIYKQKNIIDMVKIPRFKKENLYQRDLSTMCFYEVKGSK